MYIQVDVLGYSLPKAIILYIWLLYTYVHMAQLKKKKIVGATL